MSSDYNMIQISGSKSGDFIRLNTDSATIDNMSWYSERIDGIVGGDCGLVRKMENKEIIDTLNKEITFHDPLFKRWLKEYYFIKK